MENWLRQSFLRDNHNRYKHYYDEWRANLTEEQYQGFFNQYMRLKKKGLV